MTKKIRLLLEKNKVFRNITSLVKLLRAANTRFFEFFLLAAMAFGVALLDGISIGTLLPLLRGAIEMNFDFAAELPIFGNIIERFPNIFIQTNRPNSSVFILLISIIFIVLLCKNILRYLLDLVAAYKTIAFTGRLREIVFKRYLGFGKLFFDRSNVGYMQHVLMLFTRNAANIFLTMKRLFDEIFAITVYLAIMFFLSWKITLLGILLFPLTTLAVNFIIRKIEETSFRLTRLSSEQASRLMNILSCIPLVKVYSKERDEMKRFDTINSSIIQAQFSMEKKALLIHPILETLMLMILLLLISIVAYVFVKGKSMQVATIFVFFYVVRRTIPAFSSLMRCRASFASIVGPAGAVLNVLNDSDKPYVTEGQKELSQFKKNIEFKNLSFQYVKGVPVIKNLNLTLKKGEITAVVGPTGSGKTTIVSLLLRFYDCPSSAIFIDGIDIREFTIRSLLLHMAFVGQDTMLFNDTLRNNIVYGLDRDVSAAELENVLGTAQLSSFVSKLPKGLDTKIGDRGTRLSGGEKQRVSIARALLRKSEILILDEATSSLDSHTELLIQRAIEEVIKGKTTVVIAHRLSTIKNADKIVVVEDGRVIEEGTLQELLEREGKFYQYWSEQKFY